MDVKSVRVRNSLRIVNLQRKDHNERITCKASNTNLTEPVETSIAINMVCKYLILFYGHIQSVSLPAATSKGNTPSQNTCLSATLPRCAQELTANLLFCSRATLFSRKCRPANLVFNWSSFAKLKCCKDLFRAHSWSKVMVHFGLLQWLIGWYCLASGCLV